MKDRDQQKDRAIRIVINSLLTHLNDEEPLPTKPCCLKAVGDAKFHRDTNQEYIELLDIINKL